MADDNIESEIVFRFAMADSEFCLIRKTKLVGQFYQREDEGFELREKMSDGTEVFSETITTEVGIRLKTILDRIYSNGL